MSQNNKEYIKNIDILRGVAISLVVIFHTIQFIYPGFELKTYDRNGFIEVVDIKGFVLNFNPLSLGWSGGTSVFSD